MNKRLLWASLAAVVAACGGGSSKSAGGGGSQPTGDFTVQVLPSALTLLRGEDAYLLVTISPSGGFTSPVTLTASGLPPGAIVPTVTAFAGETTVVLPIRGGPSDVAPTAVTLTAAGGGRSHATTFQLGVVPPPAGGTSPVLSRLVRLAGSGFSNPTGVAVNAATGVVYMVSDQAGGLAVYDPAADTLDVVPIPSSHRVAVSSASGRVYAVGGTARLVVVDGASVRQVYVGGALQGVAVDASTEQVFVAEDLDHTVYEVDGATGAVQPVTWRFSGAADGPVKGPIAVDERRHVVYASIYGGIGAINAANGDWWTVDLQRVNSTLTQSPADVAVDPRNGQAYVLGRDGFTGGDGWIHLLDDSYLPDSTSSTATNAPTSLAVDPGTNKLYVADARNHSVNVFDLTTGAFLAKVAIPPSGGQDEGPIGVAVDPANHQIYATFRYYGGLPVVAVIDGR